MSEDIREILRRKLNEPPGPPVEEVSNFLLGYFGDADSYTEARDGIARTVAYNPRTVVRALAALETLLAEPQAPGILAELVAWSANWPLEDPSDAGARAWLEDVTQTIREVLAAAGRQHSS